MALSSAKAQWRARLLQARRARSAADRDGARAAIAEHLLAGLPALAGRAVTVCAYLPLPSEPLAPDFPFALVARGYCVLVPVTTTDEPLEWCELPGEYDAALAPGPLGVPEPAGPRLGPGAILGADIVLLPALATDPAGFRLGRGGGFYDRSLALLEGATAQRAGLREKAAGAGEHEDSVIPGPISMAVIFDEEADLPIPHGAHDARVSHVVTPSRGIRKFS